MTDTIKITALSQMGTVIPGATLTPVVDMAGTPTTKKATIANIANAILSEAGNLYVHAAKANIANVAGSAGVVSNAAQPNITSVGTLTGITSIGTANFTGASNVSLGAIGNLHISGGSSGQVLSTNGTGTLSWVAQSGGGNGSPGGSDGQVQFNDSGAFGGDAGLTFNKASNDLAVAGNVITESIQSPDGSNVTITAGTPGPAFIFTVGGALSIPGGHLLESNPDGEFELRSNQGLVISTDIANTDLHFTFATDGQIYCPANANFQGTRVNIGPESGNFELTDPTLVISASSNVYVQSALINQNPLGSSDWVAYGANGTDLGAWTDFGFTGHDFNDPNYTITGEGDGYVFVQGYANGHGNSSLVLATGENGNIKDIIFATGGFTTANEFGKISHADNSLKLTRAGSSLEFADGTFAQDDIEGTGNFGFETPTNVGFGILTDLGNSEWTFGADGNLTLPGNTFAVNYANGTQVVIGEVTLGNVTFDDVTVQGVNQLNLSAGPDYTANLAYLTVRAGDFPTHIHFDTGNNAYYDQYFGDDGKYLKLEAGTSGNVVIGTDSNGQKWTFGDSGDLTIPGNIQSITTGFSFTSNISDVDTTTIANAVIVTLVTSSVFGGPFTGQVTISDVVGTTEANGTWYFEAVEANQFQLYYDAELNYPVDGTGWPAYESGGLAVAAGYDDLSITGGNVSIINNNGDAWIFDNAGKLTQPGGLSIYPTPAVAAGTTITQDGNSTLTILSQYSEGQTYIGWEDDTESYYNVATISFNDQNTGNIRITTGNIVGTSYDWSFDDSGNLTLPSNTVAINFANGSPAFSNLVQWTTAPVANTSGGTAGQAAYDSGGNLYICVATDTWAKFAGTTSW